MLSHEEIFSYTLVLRIGLDETKEEGCSFGGAKITAKLAQEDASVEESTAMVFNKKGDLIWAREKTATEEGPSRITTRDMVTGDIFIDGKKLKRKWVA